MNIKIVVVGPLRTNCYIVFKGNCCLIIDPGDEANLIIEQIPSSIKIAGIIVTHSHDDHTGAVTDLMMHYNCRLYNSDSLHKGINQLENFTFQAIRTPGHKDDQIAIYFEQEKIMFVGDFIFKNGIGRTDMPGSSALDMKHSIRMILEYPHDITLFPGHGPSTVLSDEVNNLNYFLDEL